VLFASLIDTRTLALLASVTLHATLFAAAVAPAGTAPASSSRAEPDVTIDVLVSPEATSAIVESAPPFPDGNASPVRVSRAGLLARHRASDEERAGPRSAPLLAPAPSSAQADDEPRFTIAIGSNALAAPIEAAPGPAVSKGEAASTDHDDAALPEEGVSSPARLALGAAPPYPERARLDRVEADVPLEIVVSQAGAVEAARPLAHAGYGLDAAATTAVRQYRFRPAMKDGHPVRVRMRWIMQFRLW
jgi:TonB family protein